MDFLALTDYNSFINTRLLDMLLEGDTQKLIDSEAMAGGFIYSNLSARYNLKSEFEKNGAARNPTLIRWMLSLSVYFLHNTVPDTDIPERVAKNYDDARKEISAIASGKMAIDLRPLYTESGKSKTRFRWGSAAKRTHNPFG